MGFFCGVGKGEFWSDAYRSTPKNGEFRSRHAKNPDFYRDFCFLKGIGAEGILCKYGRREQASGAKIYLNPIISACIAIFGSVNDQNKSTPIITTHTARKNNGMNNRRLSSVRHAETIIKAIITPGTINESNLHLLLLTCSVFHIFRPFLFP